MKKMSLPIAYRYFKPIQLPLDWMSMRWVSGCVNKIDHDHPSNYNCLWILNWSQVWRSAYPPLHDTCSTWNGRWRCGRCLPSQAEWHGQAGQEQKQFARTGWETCWSMKIQSRACGLTLVDQLAKCHSFKCGQISYERQLLVKGTGQWILGSLSRKDLYCFNISHNALCHS